MSFTPAHNNSEDANTRAAASGEIADSDPLLLWEWLFLHVVLIIASYALSLQPQLQSLSWYLIYLISLGLFLLRYGAFFDGLWVALPLLLWPAIAGLSYFWSDAPGPTLRPAIQPGMPVLRSAERRVGKGCVSTCS